MTLIRLACCLYIIVLASPAWAGEQVIQFSVSDWKKTLHKIELDQQETKLLRQQNVDLKQLVTLSTEQAAACESLTKAQDEMGMRSEEYRRSLEAENTALKEEIRQHYWIMGGQAFLIAVGLIAWMAL